MEEEIKPYEEISVWGNNYDKDMNRLPETKWIPLKDLTTDHIKGILKFFEGRQHALRPKTLAYFEKRVAEEEEKEDFSF